MGRIVQIICKCPSLSNIDKKITKFLVFLAN